MPIESHSIGKAAKANHQLPALQLHSVVLGKHVQVKHVLRYTAHHAAITKQDNARKVPFRSGPQSLGCNSKAA